MILARVRFTLAATLAAALASTSASAQVFGTFAWQMQPYCNLVTMTITQIPGGYTIDGHDNQCGLGGKLGGAAGMALLNPDGTVGLEFTIVTAPSGKAVHVSASIDPGTGSGPWTDSVGNTGTFALGGSAGGLPRPVPASGVGPATITAAELAPAAVGAAQLAANAVTGASVADGSLAMTDVANGPRASFAGGPQMLTLTPTAVVVRTVSLTAPSAGTVLVHASGWFSFDDTSITREAVGCSLSLSTNFDFAAPFFSSDGSSTVADQADAFGASRGFAVAAGPFTVNLVCAEFAGVTRVRDSNITALFVAQ